MSVMGSADNPVDLGPFRRVVGVTCEAPFLAFSVHVIGRYRADEEACDGGSGTLDPQTEWSVWVTETEYQFQTAEPFGHVVTLGGSLVEGDVEVTGLPAWPSGTQIGYGQFEWFAEGSSNHPGEPVQGTFPRSIWEQPEGDALEQRIPGTSLAFLATLTATFQMRGVAFTGGPVCRADPRVLAAPYSPTRIDFSPLPFSVADAMLFTHGRAYKPIGLQVVMPSLNELGDPPPANAGTLWVLCERSPEDDQEETA